MEFQEFEQQGRANVSNSLEELQNLTLLVRRMEESLTRLTESVQGVGVALEDYTLQERERRGEE
ncbi:hypothetical protein H6F94_15255 [Leptolyngbya sp. FACHB-261]|nr:hypothetical protein [Leptolyngbya sp. FACHB-261]